MKSSLWTSLALVGALSGCASSIELANVPANAGMVVKDSRPTAERVAFRDNVRSPVQFFGDEDFSAPPLGQFAALLASRLPPGTYNLEVRSFRVMDVFPQRLGNATAGAMAGALGSMGYSAFVTGIHGGTDDNVTCLVSASLQGKPVQATVSVPYRVSPLAGMVKNDANFKAAVNECLSTLAANVAKG